jgi:hypothetical protein
MSIPLNPAQKAAVEHKRESDRIDRELEAEEAAERRFCYGY